MENQSTLKFLQQLMTKVPLISKPSESTEIRDLPVAQGNEKTLWNLHERSAEILAIIIPQNIKSIVLFHCANRLSIFQLLFV